MNYLLKKRGLEVYVTDGWGQLAINNTAYACCCSYETTNGTTYYQMMPYLGLNSYLFLSSMKTLDGKNVASYQ